MFGHALIVYYLSLKLVAKVESREGYYYHFVLPQVENISETSETVGSHWITFTSVDQWSLSQNSGEILLLIDVFLWIVNSLELLVSREMHISYF